MTQQDNNRLADSVADKIEALVEDRDLLNWNVTPAARVVQKLIAKADDGTESGARLAEARSMLSQQVGDNTERQVQAIREAFGVLHARQDAAQAKSASLSGGRSDTAPFGAVGRNSAPAANVSSPFLVPATLR